MRLPLFTWILVAFISEKQVSFQLCWITHPRWNEVVCPKNNYSNWNKLPAFANLSASTIELSYLQEFAKRTWLILSSRGNLRDFKVVQTATKLTLIVDKREESKFEAPKSLVIQDWYLNDSSIKLNISQKTQVQMDDYKYLFKIVLVGNAGEFLNDISDTGCIKSSLSLTVLAHPKQVWVKHVSSVNLRKGMCPPGIRGLQLV